MLLLWAGENDPLSGLRGSGFLVTAFPYGDGEAVWQPPPTTPLQACQLEFQSIFSKNVENRKTDVVSMDCIYSWLINVAECEKSMMLAQPNDAKVCIMRVGVIGSRSAAPPLLAVAVHLPGHLLIILVFITDSHLHTPMYFFLSNLSLCDICLSSTTVRKMLVNIQAQSRAITYTGCITQMYFFTIFAGLDDFLLAVMAYDRFVAICHPLHYTVIMNPQICVLMVLGSWVMTFIQSCLQGLKVLWLSFCTHAEIPHFLCELRQMIQLACSDTFFNYLAMYLIAGVMGGGPLGWILFSYSKIVSSIRAISSAQGKYKAFSTCASHLLVVSLFYCTGIGVFLSSAASHNTHSGASASVMYTVITPMLNPFIYSLRNKDIRGALNKCFEGKSEK
nr:olfactory receptor 7A17-like [Dasypus novemcinctus]